MALGGRKPKAAELKAATGNPGHRAIAPTPTFAAGALAPPRRWPAKGQERAAWALIVPELVRLGIAKAVHQNALEKICELHAASLALYKKEDYTAYKTISAEFRIALGEFGLTPASAGRVGWKGQDADADPADAFFTGVQLVK